MGKLSLLFRIVFFISFGMLGFSFVFHIIGRNFDVFAKIGIAVLLLSPVLTALFSAYFFVRNRNIKSAILSLLLIVILIVNVLIG